MRYQLVRDGETVQTGICTSTDISSAGVHFQPGAGAPAGTAIELSLSWPTRLEQRPAMQLVLRGRVQRSDGRGTAVLVARWEFRTVPAARTAGA